MHVRVHVNTAADSRVRAARLMQDLEMEEVEWSPGREGGRRWWLAAAGAAVAPEWCRSGGSGGSGGAPGSTRAHGRVEEAVPELFVWCTLLSLTVVHYTTAFPQGFVFALERSS